MAISAYSTNIVLLKRNIVVQWRIDTVLAKQIDNVKAKLSSKRDVFTGEGPFSIYDGSTTCEFFKQQTQEDVM